MKTTTILSTINDHLPHFLLRAVKREIQRWEIKNWKKNGKPVPPPHLIKVQSILRQAKNHHLHTFVETGTYMGDMISEVAPHFDTLFTIELAEKYYERAKKVFEHNSKIHCIQGNSSIQLKKVLGSTSDPVLFWLDAHYSGGLTAKSDLDTPIISELTIIAEHSVKNHVILIDDARLFVGRNDYPKIEELKKFTTKNFPSHRFRIIDDIIYITPKPND